MNIKTLFFPQSIKLPDSEFNKNIVVNVFSNSTTLLVDGLVESGDVMTHIWKVGIKKLLPHSFKPTSVLLLGLAGGSNAKLVNKYFPKAKITAVEIDPYMVEVGNKYFYLDKTKNLEIVVEDALDYVNQMKEDAFFDLIMVDCFEGRFIPKKLENLDFFKKLKKHSRFTLINRLWWHEHHQTTMNFLRSLAGKFYFVKAHTYSNVIISLV